MTRARHTLKISYSLRNANGRETDMTELLKNVKDNVLTRSITETIIFKNEQVELKQNPVKEMFNWESDFKAVTESYLNNITNFSSTNLNEYLACPAKYYLDRVIGLQDYEDNSSMAYGTAVHSACKFFVDHTLQTGCYPRYEDFFNCFLSSVKNQIFNEAEVNELKHKGDENLRGFYEYLILKPIQNIFSAEKEFTINIENKPFIAKIDYIEKTENDKYKVFDYKTGKYKGQSKIGWGKDNENYFRQLGMYIYVLKNHNFDVDASGGFIYPDVSEQKNRCFSLEYSEQALNKIVEDYVEAIKAINRMDFKQCASGSNACKYCQYRSIVCKRNT